MKNTGQRIYGRYVWSHQRHLRALRLAGNNGSLWLVVVGQRGQLCQCSQVGREGQFRIPNVAVVNQIVIKGQ